MNNLKRSNGIVTEKAHLRTDTDEYRKNHKKLFKCKHRFYPDGDKRKCVACGEIEKTKEV